MAMIDICKRVMAESGWPIPAVGIATNPDATAQQIFAICNTELQAISEEYDWPHLEAEYEIATVAGQSVYPWPDDFRILAQQGFFDASQYYQMKGSMDIQKWHYLKNGLLGTLTRRAFRLFQTPTGPKVEITPTPTGVQNLVATYYSNQYARDINGSGQTQYVADTDVSKVPESYVRLGVMWRFRRAKGLDFSVELAEYNSTVRTQFAKNLSSEEIAVGGRCYDDMYPLTQGYVPENGFGQ